MSAGWVTLDEARLARDDEAEEVLFDCAGLVMDADGSAFFARDPLLAMTTISTWRPDLLSFIVKESLG